METIFQTILCKVSVSNFVFKVQLNLIEIYLANALAKNAEQSQTNFSNAQNLSILSRQIQSVTDDRDRQVNSAMTRMTLQEQSMLKSNRNLEEKLHKLQETLDERKMAFNALTTRNTLLEADLTVAHQQYQDLENEMKKHEIDKQETIHRVRRECKQEKEVRCSFENFHPNRFSIDDRSGIDRYSRKIAASIE